MNATFEAEAAELTERWRARIAARQTAAEDPEADALTAQWRDRVRADRAAALDALIPELVTLPSGASVLARRCNVLDLVTAGRFPDDVATFARQAIGTGTDAGDGGQAAISAFLQAHADDYGALLDATWLACVTAPRFTEETVLSDDAIPVAAVAVDDRVALMSWANGMPIEDVLAEFTSEA